MNVGFCSKQHFYDLLSKIAETRTDNQKVLDDSKTRFFSSFSWEKRSRKFFIQFHSSTTLSQSDCYPTNSFYPSPFQVRYQDSSIQSVEIMAKYNRYQFTEPGPSFIQEPIMLTQTPQRPASMKFPTHIPLILPTSSEISDIRVLQERIHAISKTFVHTVYYYLQAASNCTLIKIKILKYFFLPVPVAARSKA